MTNSYCRKETNWVPASPVPVANTLPSSVVGFQKCALVGMCQKAQKKIISSVNTTDTMLKPTSISSAITSSMLAKMIYISPTYFPVFLGALFYYFYPPDILL